MGTHSTMVVRDKEGKITRYERTLDGQLIHEAFEEWATRIGTKYETLHPDPKAIGGGGLEVNRAGEGDGYYMLCIDWQTKSYLIYGDFVNENWLSAMIHLRSQGWTLGTDLIEVAEDPSMAPEEGSEFIP